MTTRPTDEEIREMAAEIRATWPKVDPSVRETRCNRAANMLEAWLTERQAARDGLTDEMVSITKTDANNYCEILSLLGMEEEGDPVSWVKSTLTIIHERNAKQAALESIAQPVRLPDAHYTDLNGRKWGLEPQPQQMVPDGWKLVPIEPSSVMVDRGVKYENWSSYKTVRDIYAAMIDAAAMATREGK